MKAQDLIVKKYGLPDANYQKAFCEIWQVKQDFPWFPAERFLVNKDFKAALAKAFKALEREDLESEIKTFDGCYNDRNVRGNGSASLHSWAMAVDLNASLEHLGQTFTHWSPRFIEIMTQAGLFWGGNFINRKDPMHWALFNG